MAFRPFIISFGVFIFTIHNICGRELVGEWKKSLKPGQGTSSIGFSTRCIACGRGHENIIKNKLEEKHGGMFDKGIKHNYIVNTRENVDGSNNTDSNNGKNNMIGSGSNNAGINGSRNTNGSYHLPGSGNNGPIIVSVGNQNGNGNDNISTGSGDGEDIGRK
ncbi:unnamed protein product [Lactuca saligna]|uniref:Uncharacterized protein n=1 Tax=Lactuca saligna TaxID=75948 RepID=A0AA35Y6N7_LACSI|nr:unnamed protein product [Lactuca saligna]